MTTLAKATAGLTSCCDGALTSPLTRSDADELATLLDRTEADRRAALLKALADPVRLQLLSIIRAAEPQEACVCDLTGAVNLSQPTVSHHLKVLTEAGLLTRQRRGSWAWFSLVPQRLADIASIFD